MPANYITDVIPAIPRSKAALSRALRAVIPPGYELVSWTVDATDTGPRILVAMKKTPRTQ